MNKLIEKYILTIIALVCDVLAMVISVITLSLSWNHFIVPAFNVSKLGFLLTFAIVVMWELFDFRVTNTGITTILSKTTDTPNEQIAVDYAVTNVMVSLTIALVLLVLSLFI